MGQESKGLATGAKEDEGGPDAEEDGGSVGMTTTPSSLVVVVDSLCYSAGALADANGPPREGPSQGLFAIAFFGGPRCVKALFQIPFFSMSADTFIPVKSQENDFKSIEDKEKQKVFQN